MNAHEFVADHGIEEAKRVLENAPVNSEYSLHGTYFKKQNPVEWYYWEENQWKFTSYSERFSNILVSLSELKQVVENIENIEFYGGFEVVKFKIKQADFNNWVCISIPQESDFCYWYLDNAKKAIADYELVEKYKGENNG